MKKTKDVKLKKRVNRLSIIVLSIIVIFVATASFNIISANENKASLIENTTEDEMFISSDASDNSTGVVKQFKTPDEAYRFAVNNLNNVKEYQCYVTNGNVIADVVGLFQFGCNVQYLIKKDTNGAKYSRLAFAGGEGNISIVEYDDSIYYNNKYYYRYKNDVPKETLQLNDTIYKNARDYKEVSRNYLKENFDCDPGQLLFDVNSNTIKSRSAIRDNGLDYRFSFDLNPDLACKPLFAMVQSLMNVPLTIECQNFTLSCRVDYYGNLRSMTAVGGINVKLGIDIVAGMTIPLNLNFNFVFDYSEGSGYIPLP